MQLHPDFIIQFHLDSISYSIPLKFDCNLIGNWKLEMEAGLEFELELVIGDGIEIGIGVGNQR